jgi:DNA-binding transcriptional ArsR family regulator
VSEPGNLDRTLDALSDPTKRAVIQLLLKKPRRAGELAHDLSLSPPAMSRHLRVLRKSGLITETGVEDDARVKLYRIEARAFAPLRAWLDQIEVFWGEQLGAFKHHVERQPRRPKRG